ncbi:probable HMG box-containing protein C19G7.04 at C-terminar half [Coccomyxa sp. Obi]|nr:probable HMG box-containing protein C19G7.04 at C-terminar half [Coccomyxa sp. Obi]
MYTSRKTCTDSITPHVEDQQPSSSADYEGGNSALDAAWEQAVLEPLPSTPPFAGDAVEQMPVCDQKRTSQNLKPDRPTLGRTPFYTPGSASEDSEGWENDTSDGSALSSIASFDLDKALEELELDQRAASREDATSSAKSKTSTLFYSPAATLQHSPESLDDHMSSGMAGLVNAPCIVNSLECAETLQENLHAQMQTPTAQARPQENDSRSCLKNLASNETLLERLGSQGSHMGHRASVQSAPVSPAASASTSSEAADSPMVAWTTGRQRAPTAVQGAYGADQSPIGMSVHPRQLRLGGSSEDEATLCTHPTACGLASGHARMRRLVLDDSSSEREEPAPATDSTLLRTTAVLSPEAHPDQERQGSLGARSASSSEASTPLQFSRSIMRGSRSHQTRLSDASEEAPAEDANETAAKCDDDSPQVTFTRSVARRRTVRFRLSSQFEGSDSDAGSDGGPNSAERHAHPHNGRQPRMQSPAQSEAVCDDAYAFSSSDDMVGAGQARLQVRLAESNSSSPIVLSDSDDDSTADGSGNRSVRTSNVPMHNQENLRTPKSNAPPAHDFATPGRTPLGDVEAHMNTCLADTFASPELPANWLPSMGSLTAPALRTRLPGRQQELPSTPMTAPREFVPATPAKSARPAVTPMSMAAFRRRRSALAASMLQEFNATVFGNRLPEDLEISWNAHLRTTAGTTHYKREPPIRPTDPPRHTARVELSSKVLDSKERLRATLLHELCHVAAWVLPPHAAKPPHGPAFKRWAAAAAAAHPDVPVTTCHSYDIHVPFQWQCENPECAPIAAAFHVVELDWCAQVYRRHSKSIDVARQACGRCRARLSFLGKFRPDGTPAKARYWNST